MNPCHRFAELLVFHLIRPLESVRRRPRDVVCSLSLFFVPGRWRRQLHAARIETWCTLRLRVRPLLFKRLHVLSTLPRSL